MSGFDPPSSAQALAAMLGVMGGYLLPSAAGLPDPSVVTVSLKERPLGLGNRRGNERVGSFAIVSLKGGRLEAVVRFQLWAATASEVDTLVRELQSRVLAARDDLWNAGILKIALLDTGLAEQDSSAGGWRKTTDFQLLYEFHYRDLDGAESIIARIPIHADLEEKNSPSRETTTVRNHIVRWDNLAAEPLEVVAHGRALVQVSGLAILAYLPPAWTGAPVTLARLQGSNPDPPTAYPDLPAFLAATGDPVSPDRHAQVVLPSVDDLLAGFALSPDRVPLGDWDEDTVIDEYVSGSIGFDDVIRLESEEVFRISYNDSNFDVPAVVYLRAEVHGT